MLNQPTQPTLVWMFQVSKHIEFNMIKEKVVTLWETFFCHNHTALQLEFQNN
jgi:hypothetical protein